MWPSSAAEAARPAVDLPVEQQAAADPGSERHQHSVATRREPLRSGPRRAEPRWRRCPPPPAARAARSSGRGSGTSSSGRWVDQRETPVVPLHQRGDAETHRGHLWSRRAHLFDGLDKDVERLLLGRTPRQILWTRWWTTRSSSTTPPKSLVPPASIPITRVGGMAGRYTEGGERSHSRPSGSPGIQGVPVAQAPAQPPRGRHRLRLPEAATQPRQGRRARPRHARSQRITPGRVLKWLALAVLGWLVLSFALFMISAQIQDGVSDEAERALSAEGQPDDRQHDPRARLRRPDRRIDRRQPAGPLARRHDHARPRRTRERAQALDPARHRGRGPRSRHQQDQRGLCPRGPGADDRDGRELPRQWAEGQPPRGGGLRRLPRADRLARRHHGQQQVAHLLAAVRQLLERAHLPQGGDRARRPACPGLRARPQEPVCARRRTTGRAPPASRRSCVRSGRRRSRRARSFACPG